MPLGDLFALLVVAFADEAFAHAAPPVAAANHAPVDQSTVESVVAAEPFQLQAVAAQPVAPESAVPLLDVAEQEPVLLRPLHHRSIRHHNYAGDVESR